MEAEARGAPYLLLDRDERFGFLRGFRPFDLERPEPETAADFAFDCAKSRKNSSADEDLLYER